MLTGPTTRTHFMHGRLLGFVVNTTETMHLLHDLVLPTLLFLAPVVYSFESTVPAAGQEKRFVVYDAETVHYPFTVHLPDRTTRSLPALTDPPPLLLSLSGTGARGVAADAPMVSADHLNYSDED